MNREDLKLSWEIERLREQVQEARQQDENLERRFAPNKDRVHLTGIPLEMLDPEVQRRIYRDER